MKAKIIIVSIIILICNNIIVKSQDIHFSQADMTPLLVNPAQAGAQFDLRAALNYKNQWSSVAKAYKTINFSFDMKLSKDKNGYNSGKFGYSSVGLNVFKDVAGDANLQTLQAMLSYSYQVYLNKKSTLGAGLYGSYGQRSIQSENFQWASQYDGLNYNSNLASGEVVAVNNVKYFDLGGGAHFEYGKKEKYITGNNHLNISAGIAAFHLNQPKYSFVSSDEKLNIKAVGYANALVGISNSHLSIAPGIMFFRQGKSSELIFGSMFRYQFKEESKYTGYIKGSALSLGLFYRNNDALIAKIFYEFSKYAIGVSYDINVSGLKTASNGMGGIEICLRFVNPNPFQKSFNSFF